MFNVIFMSVHLKYKTLFEIYFILPVLWKIKYLEESLATHILGNDHESNPSTKKTESVSAVETY